MRRLWSLRPLVLPLVLLAAALLLGGVAGILLGFMAGILAADRAFDRLVGAVGWDWFEAERRFKRLARQRRRAHVGRRIRRESAQSGELSYLADESGWAATAPRRRRGIQPISVASIVGTADRHKAMAFDDAFRPPEYSRGRWTLMWLAANRGATLPPIEVYRVGDEHFVRDGHHRVSVARALGADRIDADIIELLLPGDGGP